MEVKTLKQFWRKGGQAKWANMTPDEKVQHIDKMTKARAEARNKAKKISTD